VNLLIY
jgi:hypothetical protein